MIRLFKQQIEAIIGLLRLKGSFIQNFSIVFGGKAIAIIIGLLATPVIARIYDPAAYGAFAVYFMIVSNLSIVSTLRLPMSFILIPDETEYRNVLGAMFTFMLIFLLIIAIVFVAYGQYIFNFMGDEFLSGYWYLILLGIFFHATTYCIGSWNLREKAFRETTKVSLSESVSIKASNIVIGVISNGGTLGLILGDLFGKLFSLIVQQKIFIRSKIHYLIPSINFRRNLNILKKFREYPLLTLPTAWIAVLSNNFIIFFISREYSSEFLGQFTMSSNLVFIPIALIANTSQPVLMQKISELSIQRKPFKEHLIKYIISIIYLSSMITFLVIVLSNPVIDVFLGNKWMPVSLIVQVLGPTILAQILYISCTGVLVSIERRKSLLRLEMTRLAAFATLFVAIKLMTSDFILSLILYSIGYTFISLLLIVRIVKISGISNFKKFILPFSLYLLVSLCSYGIILLFQ